LSYGLMNLLRTFSKKSKEYQLYLHIPNHAINTFLLSKNSFQDMSDIFKTMFLICSIFSMISRCFCFCGFVFLFSYVGSAGRAEHFTYYLASLNEWGWFIDTVPRDIGPGESAHRDLLTPKRCYESRMPASSGGKQRLGLGI
jgi:hypothetical protein